MSSEKTTAKLNTCPNPAYHGIKCPYALSDGSPLPCFGSQEQCDAFRNKTKN
ncbi:MAG: hypothetical protein V1867_01870 [Candidatus Falkowbacteria bacterium]